MKQPPLCVECAQPMGLCPHTENIKPEDIEALPVTPAQRNKIFRVLADAAETEEEIATRLLSRIEELALGFKIGRYYKHPSGELIHIIGVVKTTTYGECLVAESSWGFDLKPVGMARDHAEHWQETDKAEWMRHFSP